MNDEIKEILEYIKKWMGLSEIPMIVKLEDYITNLQQENERLKEDLKGQENLTLSYCKSKQDYKSRCEKASNKLGNYKHYSTPTEEQNSENEDIVDSALNILQNGSDS